MNTDTGEFKMFNDNEKIKPPWREWSIDELIEVKGGLFQVVGIDVGNNRVVLEGKSKQARKPLAKLFDDLADVSKLQEFQDVHNKMMESFVNKK